MKPCTIVMTFLTGDYVMMVDDVFFTVVIDESITSCKILSLSS